MTAMDEDVRGRARISERTRDEIRAGLEGRRHGLALLLPFAGPAVVVSVAYLDPGNFAINIQVGARYGYMLVWVVLLASLMAMLFQALSAKLGIVTGRNLAELCRERMPRPLAWSMWGVSEAAAMATDLAEFVGGALGVSLLLHVPLMAGMVITAVVTCGLLLFQRLGFRPLELAIGALVGIIGVCYLVELVIAPVSWSRLFASQWPPRLPDSGAVLLACGIVGSTVMPHALFLHSGLVQRRASPRTRKQQGLLLRYSRVEVVIALGIACAAVSGSRAVVVHQSPRADGRPPQWCVDRRAGRTGCGRGGSAEHRDAGPVAWRGRVRPRARSQRKANVDLIKEGHSVWKRRADTCWPRD